MKKIKKINKFKQKKNLSQIFLTNPKKLSEISLLTKQSKNIVEIGSGTGNLTKHLLKAQQKYLIEIDNKINIDFYKKISNVLLKKGDASKILFFEKEIDKYFKNKKYCIVGNLPYHVSSLIIQKCCFLKKWEKMIFLLEENFVNKITNNEKKCFFSNFILCFGTIKKKFKVDKKCFKPIPKVNSTVIEIKPYNETEKKTKTKYQNKQFINFLKKCFCYPRKTIINNITINTHKKHRKNISNYLTKILIKNKISPIIRAEKLKITKLFFIYQKMTQLKKKNFIYRSIKSYAKVNLFLKIKKNKPSKYQKYKYLISLVYPYKKIFDSITLLIQKNCDENIIDIKVVGADIEQKNNIATKVVKKFKSKYKEKFSIKIIIKKRIKIGGGLGGESSNAFYIFNTLCEVFDIKKNLKTVRNFFINISQDATFFYYCLPAIIYQPSNTIKKINYKLDNHFTVVNNLITCETKKIFNAYQHHTKNNTNFKKIMEKIKNKQQIDNNIFFNDLEQTIELLFPNLKKIKNNINSKNKNYTGSGSTIVVFKDKDKLK